MEQIEQVAGSAGEAEDVLAGVQIFSGTGDDAFFHHGAHEVGEHLAVEAQVFLVHKLPGASVGQRADAQLNGVAVMNQFRHILTDLLVDGRRGGVGNLIDGIFRFIEGVHVRNVDVHAAFDGF